jgi:predicted lactoylglutathione lyase
VNQKLEFPITRRGFVAGIAAALVSSRKAESQSVGHQNMGHQNMEQRISLVTFGVKDLAVSRRFYVDGLGWKPVSENKEIVFFQTGGIIFAIFLRDNLAEDFQADPRTFGMAAMALAYNVRAKSEVDPLLKQAAAAGAKILKPAREASWGGYSGYFADPDGFAWEIAWNPAWRLAADGSVEFH